MRLLAMLFLLAAVMLPSGTATAAAVRAQQLGSEEHCVTWVQEDGKTNFSPLPATRCFASFSKAIHYATGGAVSLRTDARTVAETDLTSVQSSTLIGVEYMDPDFFGRTKSYATSNSRGCLDGASFSDSYIDDGSFRNTISSAAAYQGCRSTHYDLANFSGIAYTCVGSCGNLGSLNEKTESIRWRR